MSDLIDFLDRLREAFREEPTQNDFALAGPAKEGGSACCDS